jgi:hypothetical protein
MATTRSEAPTSALAPGGRELGAPNQYHLTGEGVNVSYYPGGFGPVLESGSVVLVYQDANGTRSFTSNEVRKVVAPDVGQVLSVTIKDTIDFGSVTFSLVLPRVRLADRIGSYAAIATLGITTVHRVFLAQLGQAQEDTYKSVELTGGAAIGILPA